jgi:Skp family chaperone for outer membrane proteins
MTNQSYPDTITKQSQEKFNLMKERMLEPIKQIQQARQESLRNLLKEIENKQHLLKEKRISLEKLCQG